MNTAQWELMLENTIYLPNVPQLQQRLREKLNEYKKRIAGYTEKYKSKKLGIVVDRNSNLLDAVYKSEIVEGLLENGRVEVKKIHDKLADDFDGFVSDDVFVNAISVINDYIKTGGAHTEGGSGFFTDAMFHDLLTGSEVLQYPDDPVPRAELQNKYYEYLGRDVELEKHLDTTVDRVAMKRNKYKMRILATLKEHKRVLLPELAEELADEDRGTFDRMEFYNAACQIRDLIKGARS